MKRTLAEQVRDYISARGEGFTPAKLADEVALRQKDLPEKKRCKRQNIEQLIERDFSTVRYLVALAEAMGTTAEALSDGRFTPLSPPPTGAPALSHFAAPLDGPGVSSAQNLIREPSNLTIPSVTKNHAEESDVVICQYDTGGAMGGGLVLKDQPGVIKEWRVSDDWLRLNVHRITSAKNLAIVTGFGDSMRGMFNPGDPLLVDTGVAQFDGDAVYFFRVDDEGFVKRLQSIPGEGIVVISENKAYRDWTIKPGMNFEVFAKVVKVWKGEDF